MVEKIDRRGSDRLPTTKDWLCVVQILWNDSVIISEVRNISNSGLKCRVEEYLTPGSVVNLLLLLPITEQGLRFRRIDVSSKIVRCQQIEEEAYDVGLRFELLDPKTLEDLSQYIEIMEKS